MITTEDIKTILVTKAKVMGLDTYPSGNVPDGGVSERVVIAPRTDKTGIIWDKCFVDVLIYVRDLDEFGNANLIRINELQHIAMALFKEGTDNFDDTWYTFTYDSHSTERDEGHKCHYIKLQILFEILNVQ